MKICQERAEQLENEGIRGMDAYPDEIPASLHEPRFIGNEKNTLLMLSTPPLSPQMNICLNVVKKGKIIQLYPK